MTSLVKPNVRVPRFGSRILIVTMPSYHAFVEPILRHLARHDTPVAVGQVRKAVIDAIGLTGDDRTLRLASGKLAYEDRASWAFNWLKRAGLAVAPTPGHWQLTVEGRRVAAAHSHSLPSTVRAKLDAAVKTRSNTGARPPAILAVASTTIGDRKAYRLASKPLANGGQADVFEATRKVDQVKVAMKRVRGRISGKRMRREIDVQRSMDHPNIMPILDWDTNEFLWYVMPRARRVMSDLLVPLELPLLCEIVTSVMAGLEAAHAAGHPHRDIKPQNILELADIQGVPRWVVADWGLTRRALGQTTAKLTRTGQFLGTDGFAPPEAYIDAHNVGAPGDIYSVGQLIAWATGVNPIPNVSPDVDAPWTRLVEWLTQQRPEMRPQTIAEFRPQFVGVCEASVLMARRQ